MHWVNEFIVSHDGMVCLRSCVLFNYAMFVLLDEIIIVNAIILLFACRLICILFIKNFFQD